MKMINASQKSADESALLPKQREILYFIKAYILENSYAPSVRDICAAVGVPSTSTIHKHLLVIEESGFIRRNKAIPRAMVLLQDGVETPQSTKPLDEPSKPITGHSERPFFPSNLSKLPVVDFERLQDVYLNENQASSDSEANVLGKASSSQLSFLSDDDDSNSWYIPDYALTGSESFITEMPDDSMINRQISPGDRLIARRQDFAATGDLIICAVSGETFVRVFYKGLRQVRLQAENDFIDAIQIDNEKLKVIGVVVGFVRML